MVMEIMDVFHNVFLLKVSLIKIIFLNTFEKNYVLIISLKNIINDFSKF